MTTRSAGAFAILALCCLAAGCGEYGDDYEWLPEAFSGDAGAEREVAFEQALERATALGDYGDLEPAEIAHGRTLSHTQCNGLTFRRYVIDGAEETTESHEALERGRKATGRTVTLPYYIDPGDRFVVVRHAFEVEDRWQVIAEDWVLLPPYGRCSKTLQSTVTAGEVAGAEDALPNGGQGFSLGSASPRAVKAAGKAGKPGKAGRAGKAGKASTAAATPSGASRLAVVRRRNMTARTVKDVEGRDVVIWGQTSSSSTTPGHDAAMAATAQRLALSGEYEYLTLQRSWRTATNRVGTSRKIPDIIGVRRDGRVDAVEVASNTDRHKALLRRLRVGMMTLPEQRHGNYWVIDP